MSKVYLVGAGCGAVDLYTNKALKLIKSADCIIYDRLVDPQILELSKNECEIIYVGKQAGNHTLKQEEINELLVTKAKHYDQVVRLKGGDVYVFGRGGEEALHLLHNHISFEVVPGISSSIAGLAYAGIPITHRSVSQGFHVYTAHSKDNTLSNLDFKQMLKDDETYVFLMGLGQLQTIVTNLIKVGKKKSTPIALISNASLPTQQTIVSTLENILADFKNQPLPSPMLIVVGNVVNLRKELNFFEKKSLYKTSILVTKIGKETSKISEILREHNPILNEVTTGTITYTNLPVPNLKNYDYLIFTSHHGIIGFFESLKNQSIDFRKLAHLKMMCIGNKTAQTLKQYGFIADFIPSKANSIIMNQEIESKLINQKVLLITGDTQPAITGNYDHFLVYTNQKVKLEDSSKHYDYACFTCASSVKRLKANTHITFTKAISIGPLTSQAISELYPDCRIIEVENTTLEDVASTLLKDSTL